LSDWWTRKIAGHFRSARNGLVDEFSGFVAVDKIHINGKLTLGENAADLGGRPPGLRSR